jgi:drug/metabolite transporter (DMT)-like permease
VSIPKTKPLDEAHSKFQSRVNGTAAYICAPIRSERNRSKHHPSQDRRNGHILAVANVVLDTYGSLLTKQHGANFTTWAINLIRFGSSGLAMIVISCCMSLFYCRNRQSNNIDDDPSTRKEEWYQLPHKPIKIWAQVSLGVLLVTFLCPALSNYALFQITLALALTLTSISPLYALFLEWAFYGSEKKPTLRALLGATLSVGGVVVLGIFNGKNKQ